MVNVQVTRAIKPIGPNEEEKANPGNGESGYRNACFDRSIGVYGFLLSH